MATFDCPQEDKMVAIKEETDDISTKVSNDQATSVSQPQPKQSAPVESTDGIESHQRSSSPEAATPNPRHGTPIEMETGDEQEPYNFPTFQKARKDGARVAKDCYDTLHAAAEELKAAQISSTIIDHFLQAAQKIYSHRPYSKWKIGVLGDSGTGKSSLINNLLGMEIAQTGDHGQGVTSFVTEYRYKKSGQSCEYLLEAEFLTRDEIRLQLQELLLNARLPLLPDMELELGAKEEEAMQAASEAAFSTLSVLFGDLPELQPDRISQTEEGTFEMILDKLTSLADSFEWPENANDGFWMSEADDVDDCREQACSFMEDRLWPFTKIMRVFLDSEVLSRGVILADIPGFRDTNYARVEAAKRYQGYCDEIFIVSHIARIVTDKSVRDVVDELMDQNSSETETEQLGQHISIICTRSGDMNLVTAPRLYGESIDLKVLAAAKGRVAKTRKSSYELHKEATLRYLYLFMAVRNQMVTNQLTELYGFKVLPLPFSVFTIDNKMYLEGQLQLEKDMSGVAELQKYCIEKTARGCYLDAAHLLQHELPLFVERLRTCLEEGLQDITQALVEKEITKVQTEVAKDMDSRIMSLVGDIGHLVQAIEQTKLLMKPTALEASQRWEDMHWRSYKAVCRHDGQYKSFTAGEVNWNFDISRSLVTTVRSSWTLFEDAKSRVIQSLRQGLEKRIDELVLQAQEIKAPQAVLQDLRKNRQKVRLLTEPHFQLLSKTMKLIRNKSLVMTRSSYVAEVMRPVYLQCAQDTGKGTVARCRNMIYEYLTNRDIFGEVAERIHREVETSCQEFATEMDRTWANLWKDSFNELASMKFSTDSKMTMMGDDLAGKLRTLLANAKKEVESIGALIQPAHEEAKWRGYYVEDHSG